MVYIIMLKETLKNTQKESSIVENSTFICINIYNLSTTATKYHLDR